jgi:hypothetical protein
MHALAGDLTKNRRGLWLLGVGVVVAVVVVIFRGGPGPGEVAAEYERTWDRGDWGAVWELSSPELRAGNTEAEFVSLKERTWSPDLMGDLDRVVVEREETRGDNACVVLRLYLRDAGERVHEMLLRDVDGGWRVIDPDLPIGDCPLILNYLVGPSRGRHV